ncbi:MAG: hypothetical protein N2038_12175 [Geminicoccaceae bacterium]|nr:hypothetical protein [Geminicoccaceae bacterium]MDW8125930.1 hypothetical protein [Geminicoccaceae bacterium]
MSATEATVDTRLDVIDALLRAAGSELGRTAIMKCLYILQEVEGLPLGYRFGLYTYGPYDAQVLNDLGYAEALGRVTSRLTRFPNGNQGYLYRAAGKRDVALDETARDAVKKVAKAFATRTAADLETVSTILFVDRHHLRAREKVGVETLVSEVHAIKPHLTTERIRAEIESLRRQGYLRAVA